MRVIKVRSHQREELVEFTDQVQDELKKSGEQEGICFLYVQHTTAGLTVNENADPDVRRDLLAKLQSLIPKSEPFYRHDEGNSDSHLKTSLFGPSLTVIVTGGKLLLGRWQGIFFCEWDGPRSRRVGAMILEGTSTSR